MTPHSTTTANWSPVQGRMSKTRLHKHLSIWIDGETNDCLQIGKSAARCLGLPINSQADFIRYALRKVAQESFDRVKTLGLLDAPAT